MANHTFAQCNLPYGSNYKEIDPTKKPGRGILHFKVFHIEWDKIFTRFGTTSTANDVFQCIPVAAGETIVAAGVAIYDATTGAATGDLGFTGGTLDYFIDGLALNDIADPASTDGYFDGPRYCATADTIDLKTLTAGGAGGKGYVWALIARIAPVRRLI
jgi:hypothetical protein